MIARPNCAPPVIHAIVALLNMLLSVASPSATAATLGFKSMKTAYATIKGIEVMRALRKGQASSFYYGQPQGEVCLINRVLGL